MLLGMCVQVIVLIVVPSLSHKRRQDAADSLTLCVCVGAGVRFITMNSNNTCAVDMSLASLFGIPATFYNIMST